MKSSAITLIALLSIYIFGQLNSHATLHWVNCITGRAPKYWSVCDTYKDSANLYSWLTWLGIVIAFVASIYAYVYYKQAKRRGLL